MRAQVMAALLLVVASIGWAKEAPFNGQWEVDLRTPEEKSSRVECGSAGFKLRQSGSKIAGSHWMATAGCGRMNEGEAGSVVGVVRGSAALLTVTSGRNGQVVRGRATREGANLRWKALEELRPGEPKGDSGLILQDGLLEKKGS